jgi:hypothetical protein
MATMWSARVALGLGHRLRALARLDLDPRGERLDALRVASADVGVGDEEAAARERPPAAAEDARADEDRVLGGGTRGPEHPCSGGHLLEGADRGQGAASHPPIRGRHDRVGELLVERPPHVEQAGDVLERLRQRAVGVGDPPPGLLGVELEQDDDMATERRADPLGEHAAAAEGDRTAVGGLQQLADDLRLAGAEGLLAVALEGRRDRHAELALH